MEKRVPRATYRLQFNRDFTFAQAEEILDYLKELGLSDVYASPLLRAGAQSTHGYDICCFSEINPQLGGIEGFRSFSAAARARGLGLLLDMVPNHMGSALTNLWWVDVLKHGRNSAYADFFDIDWNPPTPGLKDKVLLPVLEDHYSKVLESGKLRIAEENGEFAIAYHDHRFPISPDTKSSLKNLAAVLQEQHYRLAYWRLGPHEINYRRFFDITELVSLRMEREEVFESTHKLAFELIQQGLVTGWRIDHPDGLWNPREYFARLQAHGPIYVVAEKILTDDEPLPEDWPVDGTTGYDFLNCLNGIFVDQRNELTMTDIYRHFTGRADDFEEIVDQSKRKVLEASFPSEINSLAHRLKRMTRGQDFTLLELRRAVADLAVAFPLYRTYADDSTAPDQHYIEQAFAKTAGGAALEFLRNALLNSDERQFVMKFQQLTGPVMAKGLEDTAFYNYNRLLSLNEVGGSPQKFGVSLDEFHRYNVGRQKRWPHSLLATSTHDTKRGEDLRARLNVLSEMPGEWREAIQRWHKMNQPAPLEEYLLYQTLVGAYGGPELQERICAFMIKALREAKVHSSWTDPNTEYEAASLEFVKKVLAPANPWRKDFLAFHEKVAFFGRYNSLSQVLLKMTCPGVPDFYQGTELWDFNLVDPDNRRPVDYVVRQQMLARLKEQGPPEESKMFVIWRALQFRNQHPELFDRGDYIPLEATSPHVCAFARTWKNERIVVVVPRLIYGLCGGRMAPPVGEVWGNTLLNASVESFRNIFTGEVLGGNRLAEILKSFPIALLART